MSEFTSAVVVKDSNIKRILDLFKKSNLEGYIFSLNSDWHAVVMEEFFSEGLKITKDLSSKLNTYTFSFYNSEDDGWGYSLFYSGEQKGELYIKYEDAKSFLDTSKLKTLTEKVNIPLITELSVKKEMIQKFKNYLEHLNHIDNDDALLFEGINYFKEAFCFEKLSWVSYDYFAQLNSKGKKELGAVYIGKKKMNTKKVILSVIGDKLIEYGYHYDKKEFELTTEYAFLRICDNGFKEGLILSRDKIYNGKGGLIDAIHPRIRTPLNVPEDLFYLIGKERRELTYSTEEELTKHLEYILRLFTMQGIKWLDSNKFRGFNPQKIYYNILDEFFKKYSFERVHIDEILLAGGKVVYSNGELEIIFSHNRINARVSCRIVKNNNMQFLFDIAKQYGAEKAIANNGYSNENEYVNYLQSCLHILERYYFPNKNIGDIIYHTGQIKKSKIVEFPRKKD